VANDGVEDGRGALCGRLENGLGGGFLGDPARHHCHNSDPSGQRNGREGKHVSPVTRPVIENDEKPTQKDHPRVGKSQYYDRPSQVLQRRQPHCLCLSMQRLNGDYCGKFSRRLGFPWEVPSESIWVGSRFISMKCDLFQVEGYFIGGGF
jgi:hypothetical protein